MTITYLRLQRSRIEAADLAEVEEVDALAAELRRELAVRSAAIDVAHVHGASSSKVQAIVSEILELRLGFSEEVVIKPEHGVVSRPRPDFYFSVGVDRGVIAEVERGGTVTNNHDLKDIWKAHISPNTQHLFLIVPNANWNEAGATRERPFTRVAHRLGAFFGEERREIDVMTCHLFGYGNDVYAGVPAQPER